MGRLFGTDGVRGVANQELTPELAFDLGRAGAAVLAGEVHHRPRILIGTDTRISCGMLEAALASGICAAGADVVLCGVIPTPGVAYATRVHGYDAGVVISASHNSFEFNGIKFFCSDGYKLPDRVEDEIEAAIQRGDAWTRPQGAAVGHIRRDHTVVADYVAHLRQAMGSDLNGLTIALDCANGAASAIAPPLFRALGARVVAIGDQPDGININDRCGSTYLDRLAQVVQEEDCALGIAFDGDADRMLAVDGQGEPVDGDVIMAIIADDLRQQGLLPQDTLVVTVMSNMGLDLAARERGIRLQKTQVGDRYVLEAMRAGGFGVGGEQSGHIILHDHATTGDGMLSALCLLRTLRRQQQTLASARRIMTVLPQVLKSAHVDNAKKAAVMANPELHALCARLEADLQQRGRILVRPSGTEPIIRVMLEGEDYDVIDHMADQIVAAIYAHHS